MKADQIIPRYTYKDYSAWEGDWELINGYPYAMSPSARMKHQLTGKKIVRNIDDSFLRNKTCGCQAVYELDWIIDDSTVVRPDIMVICGPLDGDFLRYPPTLIVEILSETTRFKDRHTKFDLYQQQGVKYYLLADTTKETLEIFELKDNQYRSNDSLKIFDFHGKCQVEIGLDSIFVT
ncbi:MAG: Uma2 family endonuclease [Bacteroidota bacterium]